MTCFHAFTFFPLKIYFPLFSNCHKALGSNPPSTAKYKFFVGDIIVGQSSGAIATITNINTIINIFSNVPSGNIYVYLQEGSPYGNSHAEGSHTTSLYNSHTEGSHTFATFNSHAEGSGTTAANYSHSEGYNTTAYGSYSHAGGSNTKAIGNSSFVHGVNSKATGLGTVVLGNNLTGTTDNTVYVNSLNSTNITANTVTTTNIKATSGQDLIFNVNNLESGRLNSTNNNTYLGYNISGGTGSTYSTLIGSNIFNNSNNNIGIG